MNTDIKQNVLAKQVSGLYQHSFTLAISHPLAGALMCWLFRNTADEKALLIWLLCHALFALLRLPVFLYLKRLETAKLKVAKWYFLFTILSAVQGAWYGIFWIYFGAFDNPVYSLLVVLFVFGLSANAVVGYASSWHALLAFFIPTVVPCIMMLALNLNPLNIGLILATLLYSIVILKTVNPVNQQIYSALELNERLKHEISIRQSVEAKLRALSLQDGLTGIANRRAFDEHLLQELQRSSRQSKPLSLILCDVDFFKHFNDEYGHVEGDKCLQQIARCIQSCAKRAGELAARIGGEEFALILPSTDLESTQHIVDNLSSCIEALAIPHKHNSASDKKVVSVSIGIVNLVATPESEPQKTVHQADVALYQAKQAGRNRSAVFGQSG